MFFICFIFLQQQNKQLDCYSKVHTNCRVPQEERLTLIIHHRQFALSQILQHKSTRVFDKRFRIKMKFLTHQ